MNQSIRHFAINIYKALSNYFVDNGKKKPADLNNMSMEES